MEDLLYKIPDQEANIDLLLQSDGGDPDAADKIAKRLRKVAKRFRVIIPERAKSAATLLSLAADEIVMSDMSELGPIDPQIYLPTAQGGVWRAAQTILDTIKRIKEESKGPEGLSPAYIPVLSGIDAGLIDHAYKAIARSETCARQWLQQYMLKDNPEKAAEVAKVLSDANKYLSHGYTIDCDEAQKLELKIRYLPRNSDEWDLIWRLYTHYISFANESRISKIFESRDAVHYFS
jgi:hypothetical protein